MSLNNHHPILNEYDPWIDAEWLEAILYKNGFNLKTCLECDMVTFNDTCEWYTCEDCLVTPQTNRCQEDVQQRGSWKVERLKSMIHDVGLYIKTCCGCSRVGLWNDEYWIKCLRCKHDVCFLCIQRAPENRDYKVCK